VAIAVEYTFMPLPGANAAEVMATMHAGAALWKKHGALPRLWAVSLGEIGNMVFRVEFASVTDYGKCLDALNADPAFQAWRAANQEAGNSEWIRSNMLRELPL
jgi:hypothetical protein